MNTWNEIKSIIVEKITKNGLKYQDRDFYVFGAGILGKSIAKTLDFLGVFKGYIDNDKKKQRTGAFGYPVFPFEQISGNRPFIVVACAEKNKKAIEDQIKESGFQPNDDFEYIDDFTDNDLPFIFYYQKRMTFVRLSQISLTERCTLKCEKCAHSCYNVPSTAEDLSLEKVKESADYYFRNVDYTDEFVLIGGEPLLYKQLPEAIAYVGSKYRNKMSDFTITTNGTVVPNSEILKECVKNNVTFHVSDYSRSVPRLKEKYVHLREVFDKNKVSYLFYPEDSIWTDYGIGIINRNANEDKLKNVFDSCHTPCREVRENKFYYCVMARSTADNLKLDIGEKDYLDLSVVNTVEDAKLKILAFQTGYIEKGYLDMCNHCYGADRIEHPVPAGLQKMK